MVSLRTYLPVGISKPAAGQANLSQRIVLCKLRFLLRRHRLLQLRELPTRLRVKFLGVEWNKHVELNPFRSRVGSKPVSASCKDVECGVKTDGAALATIINVPHKVRDRDESSRGDFNSDGFPEVITLVGCQTRGKVQQVCKPRHF